MLKKSFSIQDNLNSTSNFITKLHLMNILFTFKQDHLEQPIQPTFFNQLYYIVQDKDGFVQIMPLF